MKIKCDFKCGLVAVGATTAAASMAHAGDFGIAGVLGTSAIIGATALMGFASRAALPNDESNGRDSLTGLLNRNAFCSALAAAAEAAKSDSSRSFAVLFLDLDGFKPINDTYGHDAGDVLLKTIADRISTALRGTDLACRQGGDEFVALLFSAEDQLEPICHRLAEVIAIPVDIGGGRFVSVTSSIGIAQYGIDGTKPEDLLRNADTAMYASKEKGKNRCSLYQRSMSEHIDEQILLGDALRKAIINRELELWFQPMYDLQQNRIASAEALIRWRLPDGTMIPTYKLVRVAEKSRLIADLGNLAIEAAARAINDLANEDLHLPIAINISPAHFQYSNVARDVAHRLDIAGTPPDMLAVEITEGILLRNDPEIDDQLMQLREIGVQIVLDDFGTGYSNFAYITRARVNRIKIDQSFVKDFPWSSERSAVVQSILLLANKLGIDVVAEGVETRETAAALRKEGCTYAQGYLYSPALPFDKFIELLRESRRPAVVSRFRVAASSAN